MQCIGRKRARRAPLVYLRVATALLAAVLTACATPERTVKLTALKPPLCAFPYHCNTIGDDPDSSTLVIISASGGGSRAAALLLGTLKGLDAVPMPSPYASNLTLLDHVDIISSVSGGSLTAAAFGLDHREGLVKTENWLRNTDMMDFVFSYIDPRSSIGTWFPGRAQIDVLIDMLSDSALFGRRTYAEMSGRPYVMLNAADMGAGAVFSFTQTTFDLICSDLSQFAVADAVTGSAAYPFGFSALTLRNHAYPDCPAQKAATDDIANDEPRWPPAHLAVSSWVNRPEYTDIERQRRDDLQRSYFYNPGSECSITGPQATAPQCKEWLHLLDGGIADNLGVTTPLLMMTNLEAQPSFLADIATQRVKEIIFVIVNARGDRDRALEASDESPGWISQIRAVTGSPIDATTALLEGKATSALKGKLLEDDATTLDLITRLEKAGEISAELDTQGKYDLVRKRFRELKASSILVDFDVIPVQCDDAMSGLCDITKPQQDQEKALWRLRRYMKSVPTNWWLDDFDLQLTQDVAKCLVEFSETQAILDFERKPGAQRARCFMPLAERIPPDFK